MKIKVFILGVILLFVAALTHAQVYYLNAADTALATATTKYDSLTTAWTGFNGGGGTLYAFSGKKTLGVTFNVNKVSGTVAGTATLQVRSPTQPLWFTCPGTTPITITDGTQANGWTVAPSAYFYYRIAFTNTSGSFTFNAAIISRRDL